MNYKIFTVILISLYLFSCSCSSDISQERNFIIDYYTIGGVTGKSDGITVNSDGKVNHWNGFTAANRTVTDSVKVNEDEINNFASLLEDSTLYTFKYREKGNLTTVITINTNKHMNSISYPGTVSPKEFPKQIKELITELNKLFNRK